MALASVRLLAGFPFQFQFGGILANFRGYLTLYTSDYCEWKMKTPPEPDLELRGKLIRSLGALREMLPGSFVERQRACGRPNCHCAEKGV